MKAWGNNIPKRRTMCKGSNWEEPEAWWGVLGASEEGVKWPKKRSGRARLYQLLCSA